MNFKLLNSKNSSAFFMILLFLFISVSTSAQEDIQNVKIQTMGEIEVRVQDVLKDNEKPVIFFTYFNSCEVCVKSLDELFQAYKQQEMYNTDGFSFKIVAVNVHIPTGGIQAIKEFAINKGWTFDIYLDPNQNIRKFLNEEEVNAPRSYVFLNKKTVLFKKGWIDSNPERTANNLLYAAKSIGNSLVYFDEDWNYTTARDHHYFRTVDKFDDQYIVQDRFKSGKLQMKGQFKDEELSIRDGLFSWFNPDGTKSVEREFDNGVQVGEMQYYSNGKLKSNIQYRDNMLYNIRESYDPKGNPVDKGTIVNGTGTVIIYNDFGNKLRKFELLNGQYTGKLIEYNNDGSVAGKYAYKDFEWVEL